MTDSTLIAIGERDGSVVMSFPHPVTELTFDAETARQVGEQFARSAYTAHTGREPDGTPRSMVTDSVRNALRGRAAIVIRTLLEDGRSAGYIASKITDIILSEVA